VSVSGYPETRDRVLRLVGVRSRRVSGPLMEGVLLGDARNPAAARWGANEPIYKFTWVHDAIGVLAKMEDSADLIRAGSAEVANAKREMQQLANEVGAISDFVNPRLLELVQHIRERRMAVVSEVQQTLTALKDIRRFFLDDSYPEEMQRLERFIVAVKAFQELKADGTLDAILDASIRLSVKE
jgi:hypothetical protein